MELLVQYGIRHFCFWLIRCRLYSWRNIIVASSFTIHSLADKRQKKRRNKTQRISRKQFEIIVKMYRRWIHFTALIPQHLNPCILHLKGKLRLVQCCKRMSIVCGEDASTYCLSYALKYSEKKSTEILIRVRQKTIHFPTLKP